MNLLHDFLFGVRSPEILSVQLSFFLFNFRSELL